MSGLVTVVIPTRNRREMFTRTLGTVLDQRDVDLEVVVVDEASSDDTPEYLRSVADRRVRFVRHDEPRGVSAARNRGLFEARGDWVAFTDDDDLWAPDKLSAQLTAIAKTPRAGWSCVGCVNINEQLEVVSAGHPPTEMDVGWLSYAYNVVPGGGSGVLASTDLVRSLSGFDPRLAMVADWEMWVRLANAANLAPVDRPLLGYLLHGGGMSRGARRSRWEFREMARRYRAERHREFGVDFFPWHHYLEWMADMELRAGRRWSPALLNLETLLRSRQRRQIKRVLGAAVAPGIAARRHDRWMSDHVAPAWRAEAEAWLAPLREAPEPEPALVLASA
jgi:glycosyltransferase involved in cell wall biosynthesis